MSRARPKYQVFISSTFIDLSETRQAVTWEVLAAGHIPAGMENFPATHDRGWEVIRRTIDKSDYYVIIVAGRYGTIDPSTGKSWTQREYEYAIEKGLPVLAFVRDEANITALEMEKEAIPRAKLGELIDLLKTAHHRKSWTTKDDLVTKVVQALNAHIIDDEEGDRARPGWYRGDQIPSDASLEEFARLSAENADLKEQLKKVQGGDRESLSLRNADGSELVNVVAHLTRIRVTFEERQKYALQGRDESEVKQYARLKGQTHWLELLVANTGTKAARNVVADFAFTGCSHVSIYAIREPQSGVVLRVQPKPSYLRPDEPCFVDPWDNAAVRQRIKLVAARGGQERLIRMGLCADLSVQTGMNVEYKIRSEDGVLSEGTFNIQWEVAEVTLTEDELFRS